jgi:hypothetical protein
MNLGIASRRAPGVAVAVLLAATSITADNALQWRLTSTWSTTLRVDYSWQSASFAEIHNAPYDRLRSWDNTNITLRFDAPETGWRVQLGEALEVNACLYSTSPARWP